jgi:hypothetical protein
MEKFRTMPGKQCRFISQCVSFIKCRMCHHQRFMRLSIKTT